MKRDIRRIVKEGYERGDYPGVFRRIGAPNPIEKRFLDRLLSLDEIAREQDRVWSSKQGGELKQKSRAAKPAVDPAHYRRSVR